MSEDIRKMIDKVIERQNFKQFTNENIGDKIFTNKNVNIGDIFEEHLIYTYSQKIHHTYDDFIDGDLGYRIEESKQYIVKSVDISEIEIYEFQIDDSLIEEYIEEYQKNGTYPPIILDGDYRIIDGTHRVNALNDLGIKNVIAFVGL